jgi:hypothetical protein
MWAGGTMTWYKGGELKVGEKATSVSTVDKIEKKGFEAGKPMIFVKQRIEVTGEGCNEHGMVEERTHVYHASVASGEKRVPRESESTPSEVYLDADASDASKWTPKVRLFVLIHPNIDHIIPLLRPDIQRTSYTPGQGLRAES